jgi:saccharopine dehydrogenase-like NADP-dependent oxidoreductase
MQVIIIGSENVGSVIANELAKHQEIPDVFVCDENTQEKERGLTITQASQELIVNHLITAQNLKPIIYGNRIKSARNIRRENKRKNK